LCFLNLALVLIIKNNTGMILASTLFMLEIITLFTFFIISGNPDGFSAIWIAMLPSCGMLLFGVKKTSILCAVQFAILIFFFWIPVGSQFLQYDYNATFMTRFPILYLAFFGISALLETIRMLTQKELDNLREKYKYLSGHDQLTKLLNRQGLMDSVKTIKPNENQTVFMLDIDNFKKINDTYGHNVGDIVLSEMAKLIIAEAPSAKICRWGGDEFILWFPTGGGDVETLRKDIEQLAIRVPNSDKIVHITVSAGVASGDFKINELIIAADSALYKAKYLGRNRSEY
ncbi:MAG: diguanylate cyclase, partial [Clostridia bacterium]|nr:diguanylate cyclase [Clostridia bacterium]